MDAAVDQVRGVEEGKRVDGRDEHFPSFQSRERAKRKNLAETLIGKFHDDVEQVVTVHAALAVMEKAEQMRMREPRDGVPAGEMKILGAGIAGDELDGS